MAIQIITDSTSYISPERCEVLNIKKVSLYVNFKEDSIPELEISNDVFYKRMETEGIPISSQPATGEILEIFEESLKKGDDIIAVFLSSQMSGTYQSGLLVKDMLLEKYPQAKITIIDSKSNSMQLGYSVIEGAKAILEQKSYAEVVSKVEAVNASSRFVFVPNNLDYLRKGGRIGMAKALLGNALHLTPILTVNDGQADTIQTVRTKKRAKKIMLDILKKDHEQAEVQEVAIHHINNIEEAQTYKAEVEAIVNCPVIIADIGPVIGVHVGPGALGLAYHTKEVLND